jgi:hypothetical protein
MLLVLVVALVDQLRVVAVVQGLLTKAGCQPIIVVQLVLAVLQVLLAVQLFMEQWFLLEDHQVVLQAYLVLARAVAMVE